MKLNLLKKIFLLFCLKLIVASVYLTASELPRVIVQSTTSTANSGFFEYIKPHLLEHTGIDLSVVAVGTGQAIKNAKNCDGDMLLVHSYEAEKKFVKSGFGIQRFDLMYNDFVLLGPASDPARVSSVKTIEKALKKIALMESFFASRGDDSGTHRAELKLWRLAGINPVLNSGKWYLETGSGMGATLNFAGEREAYVLADRATWLSFRSKRHLKILFEGDKKLFNQYGLIGINKLRCPHVDSGLTNSVIDWLLSEKGQVLIGHFKVDDQQLFYPNAEVSYEN